VEIFKFANNAHGKLSEPISAADTLMKLIGNAATLFPTIAGEIFTVTITDAAAAGVNEIVYVTAVAGDTFTVRRGQEGTVARAWLAGAIVANLYTAGTAAAFLQSSTADIADYCTAQLTAQSGVFLASGFNKVIPAGRLPAGFRLVVKFLSAPQDPLNFLVVRDGDDVTQYPLLSSASNVFAPDAWKVGFATALIYSGEYWCMSLYGESRVNQLGLTSAASAAQVNAGLGGNTFVSPQTLSSRIASTTATGLTSYATAPTTLAGLDSNSAVTPRGLGDITYTPTASAPDITRKLLQYGSLGLGQNLITDDVNKIAATGFYTASANPNNPLPSLSATVAMLSGGDVTGQTATQLGFVGNKGYVRTGTSRIAATSAPATWQSWEPLASGAVIAQTPIPLTSNTALNASETGRSFLLTQVDATTPAYTVQLPSSATGLAYTFNHIIPVRAAGDVAIAIVSPDSAKPITAFGRAASNSLTMLRGDCVTLICGVDGWYQVGGQQNSPKPLIRETRTGTTVNGQILTVADLGRPYVNTQNTPSVVTLPNMTSAPDGGCITIYNASPSIISINQAPDQINILAFGASVTTLVLNRGDSITLAYVRDGKSWVQVAGHRTYAPVYRLTNMPVVYNRKRYNDSPDLLFVNIVKSGNINPNTMTLYVNDVPVAGSLSAYNSSLLAVVPPAGSYFLTALYVVADNWVETGTQVSVVR
jgi:hypothetical protein